VLADADSGEPTAVEIVTSAAEALAGALANVVDILDPARVVLGGGRGHASGLWGARSAFATPVSVEPASSQRSGRARGCLLSWPDTP
jgi:predicted NBD/HSP70 family sugar kinase